MRKLLVIAMALLFASQIWGSGKDEGPPPMMEAAMDTQMEGGTPVLPPTAMGGEYMKPSDQDLKKMLTPLQYQVTQHEGTEAPWDNVYWDTKENGIYVDIVSGEPLFSSTHKYDSRTGWPSFTQPLEAANIVEKKDAAFGMVRVEVRSFYGDSHLGHVFDDGPAPTGLRYCMNSASLRFVPVEDMENEGYGTYLSLFENK